MDHHVIYSMPHIAKQVDNKGNLLVWLDLNIQSPKKSCGKLVKLCGKYEKEKNWVPWHLKQPLGLRFTQKEMSFRLKNISFSSQSELSPRVWTVTIC